MLNKPTILAVTLAPMKEALLSYGVDFDALTRQAGIDPGLLARTNARCPVERIQRLWQLAAGADRMAARYIEGMTANSVATTVRALLLKAMPSGNLEQDGIARSLNQSASTLQLRLREEGTSYQRLLDATRRDMALEYLKEGRHSLAEITFLLGFADQSNFTRAFRRWTGRTPRHYLS
jgi:AraC-like DNA-binding protein